MSGADRGWRVEDTIIATIYASGYAERRWRHPAIDAGLVGVLQFPSYCIEHSRESVFCHTTTEQRVCRQCAECVVADLVVGWRCALADEVEVCVGAERRSVEEDKPSVCAEVRLRIELVNG